MGLALAPLEHMVAHAYTDKNLHKPLPYIQQTVNILTIEHVYRYATLLLGVRVFLGGVRIDTYVSSSVTFVGGCVISGR